MQFSKNKKNEIELKTKNATVIFDHKVAINDVELEGAGEYEIGGVSVEGIDDNLYVFQAEDVVLGAVDFKQKMSKEHLEKMSSCEALFVRLDGNVEDAIEQVNQIEPKISIYFGSNDARAKLVSGGIDLIEQDSVKLTRSDLEEERAYFFQSEND
ncbi:MAG: hypothetical protein BWY43_00810 [candidate division WS2 bacterium ADurb.Bin280]|uniref:Uncharacterized protein n=1 Tax=candidate division WS2 bacterium ADurb.Bin280 TaxID=1852829 RepID=A0A1V5SCP1_9BACT|nr:MAG: hypothetical protein BWY43_00810 [candidate division WS2 bacterium ADurb.Bin280]